MMTRTYEKRIQRRRGDSITSFFAVFSLIAIRFLYYGFRYFPQLDDYIQHHNYAAEGNLFYLIEKYGLLSARPLAGVFDVTLWSWLWPCAILGVLLLSALYAVSAIEFLKIFQRYFGTSPFFIVIYALLPLGIEGTYWMSASTRIIPGLLFTAWSAKCLCYFLDERRKRAFFLSVVCQFVTFCFYEQTAVLSCALNVLISLLYLRDNRRWYWSFSCVLCGALYFLCTTLAGPSAVYGGRTEIILPFSAEYYTSFLPELFSQFKSAFLGGGYYTFVYGFIRGIMRIVKDGAVVWCLLTLAFCIFFGMIVYRKHKAEHGYFILPLVFGAVLLVAPLAPFFVVQNPWFSFRGTVASFVGIALILDCIIRLLTQNNRVTIAVLSSFVACIFCICGVSEIADYRATYLADQRVVQTVSEISENYQKGSRIAIFNVDATYVTEQNSRYHEHITGVTESDWALTGAIRCYNENPTEGITYVPVSMKNDPLYKPWNYATMTIPAMDGIYLYDYAENSLEKLTVVYTGDDHFELYFEDGEKFGTVIEKEKHGYFFEE